MKKNVYPLLIILVVLIIGVILLVPRKGDLRTGDLVFHELDTSKITQIIITPAEGYPLKITRENFLWMVNDSIQASPVAVENMLFILKRMIIKGIADTSNLSSLEFMKVVLNETRKDFNFQYAHGENTEIIKTGEGHNLYHIEISGFPELRFSQVFSGNVIHWRDNSLISYRPESIAAIHVEYPFENHKSFTILKYDNVFGLYDSFTDTFYPHNSILDSEMLMYTSYFMDVFFDSVINEPIIIDSVFHRTPEMKISIDNINGEKTAIQIWPVIENNSKNDRIKFVRRNEDRELLVINQLFTDLWSKQLNDFLITPKIIEK
jgi:hypothetical protein